MSKKQTTLTSFFSSPRTPAAASRTPIVKKEKLTEDASDEAEGRPLKRVNLEEGGESPVKRTPSVKRRRIVVSSDEEDENEAKVSSTPKAKPVPSTPLAGTRAPPCTPATVARPPANKNGATPLPANKSSATPRRTHAPSAICTEAATSFIDSFRMEEQSLDDTMASVATLDQTIYQVDEKSKGGKGKKSKDDVMEIELEKYEHETLEWLKDNKVKDASGRKKGDPDYDPTTLWVPADFLKQQTPGHRQWWTLKAANFDTILLFKVGKFYELYHMDAVIAVECLSMAYMRGSYAHSGFPESSYGKYADQLVSRGYKVARVEQTETPQQLEERNKKKAGAKDKVVARELCRVTTCGTRTYGVLDGVDGGVASTESGAKYLLAIKEELSGNRSVYGVCFIDSSVGQFWLSQFEDDEYRSQLRTMLASHTPVQVLLERGGVSASTNSVVNSMLSAVPKEYLAARKQFFSAEETVKMMTSSSYLGPAHSDWPLVLRGLLDSDSVIAKPDSSFTLTWSALGAVIGYLKRCLIDVDMITMRMFSRFSPSVSSAPEKKSPLSSAAFWTNRQLVLDGITLENLNIVPSSDTQAGGFSLYNTLNKCVTPFGKRLLRQWVCSPTCDPSSLIGRQDSIAWLSSPSASSFVQMTSSAMKTIPDLDRLVQKIHTLGLKYRAESHPDSRAVMFESLRYNKRKIADLLAALQGMAACQKVFDCYAREREGAERLVCTECQLLEELLGKEHIPQLTNILRHFDTLFDHEKAAETGCVVPEKGRDSEYDEAAEGVEKAKQALESYRKEQQVALKCQVVYWGSGKSRYQMEIPDAKNLSGRYELKSKRKGFGRYQTSQLVALISALTEAEAELDRQASDVTRKIFAEFDKNKDSWSSAIRRVATLDVLLSLARYSQTCGLEVCRPTFVFDAEKPMLSIKSGYHPCLATNVVSNEASSATTFIANDAKLGGDSAGVVLLTGPNMGGKSTLMRQVAVLTVMAHMGCMVPAREMVLTPVDRIFTRIGANDRIMCGQSTFFVELNETQVMLRDATVHSLVLVDELGRGTSTFDGTAIASAVLSYLSNHISCRSYFSTHYHSLCQSAAHDKNIAQAHMACMVENENDEDPTQECVTFLYRLTQGVCPKSYGFYAAKLSGVREEVVRAAFVASARIVGGLDDATRARLRDAAKGNASVEELRKMVECL